MGNFDVIICDCDHKNVEEEAAVFQENGISYQWLHCATQEEVIQSCKGARVLLNQYVKMNANIFSNLPDVQCVVRYGVGYDNVNIEDATRFGVQVCNVPDYGTEEVADQAFAFMMTLERKIYQTSPLIRQGIWNYQNSIPIHRNRNKVVGIIGVGRIGTAFAKRVQALGCKVLGTDIEYGLPSRKFPDFVEFVSLEELARRSDVISIHCSLNERSYHLIDASFLQQMKPNAILINVARGGIIDEIALEQALSQGKLAGVGLDVVEHEPLSPDSPLLQYLHFLVSPHIAWYSEESAKELKRKCALEAVRFLKGEKVQYPINHITGGNHQ